MANYRHPQVEFVLLPYPVRKGMAKQRSRPMASQAKAWDKLMSHRQHMASRPLANRPLANRAMANSRHLAKPMASRPMGNRPMGNQPMGNRPMDNRAITKAIRPLASLPLGKCRRLISSHMVKLFLSCLARFEESLENGAEQIFGAMKCNKSVDQNVSCRFGDSDCSCWRS